MSCELKDAYQDIADTLNTLVNGKIICGEKLPTPSARLEHEFVVEVPVKSAEMATCKPVRKNSPTSGNSQI
jgi:hypothetical protein